MSRKIWPITIKKSIGIDPEITEMMFKKVEQNIKWGEKYIDDIDISHGTSRDEEYNIRNEKYAIWN